MAVLAESEVLELKSDHFEDLRSMEQDLHFRTAAAMFEKNNIPFGPAQMKTLGLVAKDGLYTNLALLLSDECPETVKAATFSGLDKEVFQDRREFSGSIFRQMEDLYAYLDFRNQTRASFEGLYRVDTRDYPEEALREALLNCIVHREYAYSANTLVSVYTDRIEFVSIGGLPEGVELEDILLGLSVCRNPKLAAIFYRLRLIEAYGTGVPKIMRAYKDCQRQPVIEVTRNAFKITLPNVNVVPEHSGSKLAEPILFREKHPLYTKEIRKILELLHTEAVVTRPEVDALLGTSQATSSRILREMLESGLIEAEGHGKNTRYKRAVSVN